VKGFFERVYALVAEIPAGNVATYGQIAFLLDQPHNARVVGWAMRKPPGELNLPAHRVVNKTGRLSPAYAFGGQEVQRLMLEAEGITFSEQGRIHVRRHLWEGPEK
jgi:methylated-DNA-protein-cysteine methyltransferase related protein